MKNVTIIPFLWVTAGVTLFAHEITTHKRIGDAAVVYLNAAYLNTSPVRPLLLGTVGALQNTLQIGAQHEDDAFGSNLFGYNPYGRFTFHFTPPLDDIIPLIGNQFVVSANGCSSVNWGQSSGAANGATGCSVSCSIPFGFASLPNAFCGSISGVLHTNSFRWDQDLVADSTGAPSATSITGFGYVVHLLEDLGSPAHTRNDAHPCASGNYCDQFEKFNDNAIYAPFGDPQQLPGNVWSNFLASTILTPGVVTQVIPTTGFTAPTDFFNALQQYVSTNYYSNRTVFQGTGPTSLFSKGDYFYGSCITSSGVAVSQIAGTCQPVVNPVDGQTYMVRKIGHKSQAYWASCPNPVNAVLGLSSEVGCDVTKADIDQTIAREQFSELGPVIAQHVAAFMQFYAPDVSVALQGSGSGTVTSTPGNFNCGSGTCPALFVQGSTVFLTATHAAGSTFAGWAGACASAGTNTIAQLTLTSDVACTATFNSAPAGCPAQTVCGTVTDFETGTVALHGIVIELRSSTGAFLAQTTTDNTGKYSFGSLAAPNYFVDPVLLPGEFPSPSQLFVSPGGQPANFKVGGVPASVTVTGPGSFTLAIFTLQPIPPGPPPCQGAGCPVSISGILPFSNPFSVPNGTWWLTCYVNDSVSQKTSNQQFVFTPQESITISCPQ